MTFDRAPRELVGNKPAGAPPHLLGTPLSHTKFDESGHQTMVGDARPFRDEIGDALALQVLGVGISVNAAEGTRDFATNANLSDYLFANVQLNHDRDLLSVIKPHIHFFQTSAAMPNFLFQYRWQRGNTGKTTAWVNLKCNLAAFTYVSGTLNQIAVTASGIIPPVDSALSDIVQFRILRDNANTSGVFAGSDPYAGPASVLSFDVHLQLNSIGSDEEYVK